MKMTRAQQRANRGPKPASPTKLRDGTWGATVDGKPRVGEVVRVTTRGGKSWDAKVTRVIWQGNGVSICATATVEPRTSATQTPRTFGSAAAPRSISMPSCGYRCPVGGHICTPANPCHDCE